MGNIEITSWNRINSIFGNSYGILILGNGASISFSNSFNYHSLYEKACEYNFISEESKLIFNFFQSNDFELILRMLWYAHNINKALKIEDEKTLYHYNEIRDSLIKIVREVHPSYIDVQDYFPAAALFLKKFKTILSLNYDIVLYWVMLYSNKYDYSHAFKDCFDNDTFHNNWFRYRDPIGRQKKTTLVFYPHGNLLFCNQDGVETKVNTLYDSNLLDEIFTRWSSDNALPLFVSEGTSKKKIESISKSRYLNIVNYEVAKEYHSSLTIYGWSMDENDGHILNYLHKPYPRLKNIAISVYKKDLNYCINAKIKIEKIFGEGQVNIHFFDSDSCFL